jgi:regulator of sirC expression with transglutaminase-like and TPR domain
VQELAFASLLRFEALLAKPEAELDLAEGALLVAEVAYPTLDHMRYLQQLDALAGTVCTELGEAATDLRRPRAGATREVAERTLEALRTVLVEREGFRGNAVDYYDANNSYLNAVLDRRVGLPITLSVVYLEVARRLGAPLRGVALPAHFVVKWPLPAKQGGDIFLDAFASAELLDAAGCKRLVARVAGATGASLTFDPNWTAAVGPRVILTRLLTNLKMLYLQRGETQLALEIVERLILLRPDAPEELRDRGLLRLALGEPLLAAADISAYAARTPDAPDLARLRRRLAATSELRCKLN